MTDVWKLTGGDHDPLSDWKSGCVPHLFAILLFAKGAVFDFSSVLVRTETPLSHIKYGVCIRTLCRDKLCTIYLLTK